MDSPLHLAVIGAWECAIAGVAVTYLSGPITTGPRLLESLRAGESLDERTVIDENSRDMRVIAERLRGRGGIVVEPGSLSVVGWSQQDYLALWEAFIGRFATEVVFMPGWEFSAGCAREFACAMECELPTRALVGSPIGLEEGWASLAAALEELEPYQKHPAIPRVLSAIDEAIKRLAKVRTLVARTREQLDG